MISRDSIEPIQTQLRRSIIESIHTGSISTQQRMQSSRQLADRLGIARNTVTAVYEELVARGYLESVPRQGYFVSAEIAALARDEPVEERSPTIDWEGRLHHRPSQLRHIVKPSNWQDYPYPFVFGQVDPRLFPINTWRACSRDALGRSAIDWWSADRAVEDDPLLVEQIRSQILVQRGIYAKESEILVTLGSQEGFYLLARLLARSRTRVGVEMPGYPDARTIFAAEGATMVDLAIDADGAQLSRDNALDIAILTPVHQCPTMVTMSPERRAAVMETARRNDTILIEDDYDGETAYGDDTTTLKSMDADGRVAYLGTLSKVLAPGVRLGFLVADAPLIEEARWLRRLIHRSAPLNNQRTAAIFLAEGHYFTLLKQLREALARRFDRVMSTCDRHLPGFTRTPSVGGSSVWLRCPNGIDGRQLLQAAAKRGVLFESGDPFVPVEEGGRYIRLGISYIDDTKVEKGLSLLGEAVKDCR